MSGHDVRANNEQSGLFAAKRRPAHCRPVTGTELIVRTDEGDRR